MDFARKQLEKYGWTDGKGLGKNENGISQALKPKLKRSVTGVGHDLASEFNEHWWTMLYDKAAGNLEVKETNGTTKKIKTKDDFTISTNTWRIKHNPKLKADKESKEQYSEYFVRTAVMSGGNKVENVKKADFEDFEEEKDSKDLLKMTDEELFAACEGRTAHKGARHGLKALGKLSRIAEQEKLLLTQSRYNGYSHAKKQKQEEVLEELSFETKEVSERKKKKKKRKCCFSNENLSNKTNTDVQESVEKGDNGSIVQESVANKNKLKKIKDLDDLDVENIKKAKKNKRKNQEDTEVMEDGEEIDKVLERVKKKKRRKNVE